MRANSMQPPIGPDALRCPELHDFSDLPRFRGRSRRPLMIVLAIAAALMVGHLVLPGRAGDAGVAAVSTPATAPV